MVVRRTGVVVEVVDVVVEAADVVVEAAGVAVEMEEGGGGCDNRSSDGKVWRKRWRRWRRQR